MAKSISQRIVIQASAHEIYESLMDSKKHSKFTGDKAKIGRKVGEKFSAYGDYVSGVNLQLVPDKKIFQTWRASDWPEGKESKISIELKEKSGKTEVVFKQTGIPDSAEVAAKDWDEFYWIPLKEMLENQPQY